MIKCLECDKEVSPERFKAAKRQICIKCAEQEEKEGRFQRHRMGFVANDNIDDPSLEMYLIPAQQLRVTEDDYS